MTASRDEMLARRLCALDGWNPDATEEFGVKIIREGRLTDTGHDTRKGIIEKVTAPPMWQMYLSKAKRLEEFFRTPPPEQGEVVPVKRWWLTSVIRSLQDPLPRGRIGDAVFLLRDQLQNILDRSATPPAPSDDLGPKFSAEISQVLATLRPAAGDVEAIAETLCAVDGNGFLQDCTPTMQAAYKIRAEAVAALRPAADNSGLRQALEEIAKEVYTDGKPTKAARTAIAALTEATEGAAISAAERSGEA